jgi:GT2 family glycosyltransferase
MLISIIILNYNRKLDSLELIASIKKQVYKNIEIIWVDNASTDNSVEKVRTEHRDITYVLLKQNIGRAGHNEGAKIASGAILVFLDADVYFTDRNFFTKLADKFRNKAVDAVSFFMKDPSKKTYGWEPNYFIDGNTKKGYESTFGGGMWAIRRKIFEKVGGFNPDFFIYVDEWEYLLRLWEKGYSVRYFPDLIGYHKESPYSYRAVMRGYHVIINHAQLLVLYIPFNYWFKFYRHYTKQTSSIIMSGQADRFGVVKGILYALYYSLKSLPKRHSMSKETIHKFLRFYFPKKGDVVVGKWGYAYK